MVELAFNPNAPIPIAQEAASPSVPEASTPGSLKDVLAKAREVGKQNKGEGFFGKALRKSREGLRAVMDITNGMKNADVRDSLKVYIEQKKINAKESFDGWMTDRKEYFNEQREAAIMATRNSINAIAERTRNAGQMGLDVVAGGAFFTIDAGRATVGAARNIAENTVNSATNTLNKTAIAGADAARSVGAAGVAVGENAAISIGNTLNTGIEAGKVGVKMGVDTAKFFGDIARQMPNEAQRWKTAAENYYDKKNQAVRSTLKTGAREIFASFLGALTSKGESVTSTLTRLTESGREISLKQRSQAEKCRYHSQQFRELGKGVQGPVAAPVEAGATPAAV